MVKTKIGNKDYEIDVSDVEGGLIWVRVNGNDYFFKKNEFQELVPVKKEDCFPKEINEVKIFWEKQKQKEIKSPMTGTISSIEVKEGDKIKSGQKLMVLIAMKMESEIVSETEGIVKEVKVKESQLVNSNDVLIILE